MIFDRENLSHAHFVLQAPVVANIVALCNFGCQVRSLVRCAECFIAVRRATDIMEPIGYHLMMF